MKEFKLIVASGHDFENEDLVERVLIAMADTEFADMELAFVSSMSKGADALAYMFAHQSGLNVYEFNANKKRYGIDANYACNNDKAEFSDGLLAFWDGASKETAHLINAMQDMGKPVTVVQY